MAGTRTNTAASLLASADLLASGEGNRRQSWHEGRGRFSLEVGLASGGGRTEGEPA